MRKGLLLCILASLLMVVACSAETSTPTSGVPTVPPTDAATAPPAQDIGPCAAVPPVTRRDWVRGPSDAPITVIEYAEFQ